MRRVSTFLLCAAASAFFHIATAPGAFADPILATASNFAVLAGTTVTNTGPTVILTGDVGVSPGSAVTGFPPGSVATGTILGPGPVTVQAQNDLTAAYNALAGLAPTSNLTGVDLGGQTLTSGVYFFASSAQLTGALTLNAQNNPNAFWVFQIGSTLTTASASTVNIINGTGNNALYWQVGSSATLGTTTSFQGNIVALTSIALQTGATINCGRALARNGAVTLDTNIINSIGCAGSAGNIVIAPGGTVTPVPEPGTLLFLAAGIACLVARRPRPARGRQRDLALEA